jgi:formylglycine-generating enzyme required for sulfatase activity
MSNRQTAKEPEVPNAGDTRINPIDGAEMVYVPAGEFSMGDDDLDRQFETCPRKIVKLDAFRIYKNEVTVAQYLRFCEVNRRKPPGKPKRGWKDNHPVVNVT